MHVHSVNTTSSVFHSIKQKLGEAHLRKYVFNKDCYQFSHVYSAMQLFCNNKANLITTPQSSGALGHLLKCTDLTIN